MASCNKVFLIGNLTRDPDIRKTPKGSTVGDIGIAINSSYKDKDGKDVEESCFVDIVVWGKQAETCGEYLKKGSPIFVEGKLQLDQWEHDGKKCSKLRVRAERIQFLGSNRKSESTYSNGGGVSGASNQNAQDDDIPF